MLRLPIFAMVPTDTRISGDVEAKNTHYKFIPFWPAPAGRFLSTDMFNRLSIGYNYYQK